MGKINGTAENILLDIEVVDYIVEQGTDGIWTYRKWASGIVECWGLTQYSVTPNQAWGDSHFYGTIDAIVFPEGLFINTPVLTVSVCDGSGTFFVSKRNTTAQNTGPIYAVTVAESKIAISATFSFSAKGRWKEREE